MNVIKNIVSIITNPFLVPGKWQDFEKDLNNLLLTGLILANYLTIFWNEVMHKLDDKQFILILLKIKYRDGGWKTLTPLQKVNKGDYGKLLDLFIQTLDYKSDDYRSGVINKLSFVYKIIPADKLLSNKTKIITSRKEDKQPSYKFFGHNLPNTMDLNLWGNITNISNNKISINDPNRTSMFVVTILNKFSNSIAIKSGDQTIFTFTDTRTGDNLNTFTRVVNNHTYYFIEGNLVLKQLTRKTAFLQPIKKNSKLVNKILILDIETRVTGNILSPYCICIYDGLNKFTNYLSDFSSPKVMLEFAIQSILNKKYNGHTVYVHNLSNFDGVFLLNVLTNLPNTQIKFKRKDGQMIEIRLTYGSKGQYHLNIRDSLLMFPNLSLRLLAISFQVLTLKGHFPFTFASGVPLDYTGAAPGKEFYCLKVLTQVEYLDLIKDFKDNWSLREESLKYCLNNCITLYEIITKFNTYIFDLFKLNIHKFPTLPSLAFENFRTNYLKDSKIPLITGQIFHDIKSGYTGGATDVYKFYGKKVYAYDVNSLYPNSMLNCPVPTGNITFFEGDITKINPSAYGFFKVEITAPANLNKPILQTKVLTPNGHRTVAPLGTWTDYIYSPEMENAKSFGYTFKILEGYTFDKGYIFKDYDNDLYKIK